MAKALGYLFHYRTSCGLIKGIPLPSPNGSQMVNGHFVDNCFLIALEEQDKLVNTMDCIYIFNEFSHSKVQMAKMQCYHITQESRQYPGSTLPASWTWTQCRQIFKFLGIPFAFQASTKVLWEVVLQRMPKKVNKWITNPFSLMPRFQICSKILLATDVYQSSYYVPFVASYQ